MPEVDNTTAIIQKFEPLLDPLNFKELTILNKLVVERINLIQKAGIILYMSKFKVGETVSWDGRDGVVRKGTIIRLNHKTASVKATDGVQWNVSPHILRKEN